MNSVAKIISLTQSILFLGLAFFSATRFNTYTAMITSLILIKFIPEMVMKLIGKHYIKKCSRGNDCNFISKTYADYSKRPREANDCGVLNSGGPTQQAGMPSGHSITSGMISWIVGFECIDRKSSHERLPIGLLVAVIIISVLVPMSRVDLKCHTTFQTVVGNYLGALLAFIFRIFEQKVLNKNLRYIEDKKKFYDLFIA